MQNVDHPGRGSVDWIRRMIVAFAALSVVSGILYGDTGSSKAALATGARVRPPTPCRVTRPTDREQEPPPTAHVILRGSEKNLFGRDSLWVLIPPRPIAVRLRNGHVYSKIGWFIAAPGKLHVVGRRIDGKRGTLKASVPEGYGPSPDGYMQPSAITVSSLGCWEITGTVGSETITWIYSPRIFRPR
jgi:hypothetical protein